MSKKDPAEGTYQNYKGDFYEVLGVASEPDSGKRFVVYRSLGLTENLIDDADEEPKLGHRIVRNGSKGALSLCSVERFNETVDGGAYRPGKTVPRFRPAPRPVLKD
jgi:hypothetical protein